MKKILATTLFFAPQLTLAATTIPAIIDAFAGALGGFVPIAVAVAVVVFVWGAVSMMAAGMDDRALEQGRKRMIWGVVGLFVIVSIWGLVALLAEIIGVDSTKTDCKSPLVPVGGAAIDESRC